MIDGQELQVELLTDLGGVALLDHVELVAPDAVLLELALQQGQVERDP